MPSLHINDLPIEVEQGATVLDAVRSAGCSVPTLCHLEGRLPFGECRLCMVEVADRGGRRLVAACSFRAVEGMQVWTETERVGRARRMIAELLLASCPQASEIREVAERLGVTSQRFRQEHEPWLSPVEVARERK